MASTEGLGATPRNSAYVAAKHGVIGLTRAMAVEFGKEGITANCICPGPILTGITEAIPDEHKQVYANRRTAEARGESAQLLEAAEGYRARVVNDAVGEASRFEAVLAEYEQAPEVIRKRLYIETMQKVLGDVDKIILEGQTGAAGGQGVVPYLPLNELRRSGGNN